MYLTLENLNDLNDIISKLNNIEDEDEKKQLYAFEYSSISALRDIKRVFNNRLMDYFTEKGVLR